MVKCLVCASDAAFRYAVPADGMRRSLAGLFRDEAIWQIEMPDYKIFRCGSCQLEFADPAIPGSDAFYHWTVAHEGYYPAERWEWGVVRRRLEAMAALRQEPLTVVDVGCGAGAFLDVLAGIPNVRGIGIDITAQSVAACRERGHEAYCADFKNAKSHISGSIDVITAFHSLEHVADPLGFVNQARDLAGTAGLLMISTPYSPMSFEEDWFDPLNHPPHHMTRWNEESYRALADRTRMKLTVIPGPVRDPLRRALQAFSLKMNLGVFEAPRRRRAALVAAAARHPLLLAADFFRQVRRRRLDHRHAPDVILVELNKAVPDGASGP